MPKKKRIHICNRCQLQFSARRHDQKRCDKCSPRRPIEKKFWEQVNKDADPPSHCPEIGQCWLWTGYVGSNGYGPMGYKGRNEGVHRLSWILHFGDIPNKLHVLHHCDNPICVNPSHLFLGTNDDNMRDMHSKGRRKGPRGEINGNSRLSVSQVLEIKRRLSLGEKQRLIAQDFNISRVTVSDIGTKRRWRHLS